MSPSAYGTSNPADAQRKYPVFLFNSSGIITVNVQTGGMPASAGKLVELEASDETVIKILG